MDDTGPILYFILFILVMANMALMVRLSDVAGKIADLKEKMRQLKGEQPEEPPEWL